MRFLAEAAWYPAALLPGQGVTWSPIDDRSADATLTDGESRITLRFTFGSDDLIESVYSPDIERMVAGTARPTPWEGRFTNYEQQNEMLVPVDGDVGWILPEGRLSYWRGHTQRMSYELR